VPRPKRDAQLYDLAKRGAEARLHDLVHEARILLDLFPHLRDSFDKDELPVTFILRTGRDRAEAQPRRGRRPPSPKK